MDGYGVMNEPSGNKYEGLFKNNLRHGKGLLKYANGDIYEGNF